MKQKNDKELEIEKIKHLYPIRTVQRWKTIRAAIIVLGSSGVLQLILKYFGVIQ